ncbi:patatin-like phospholipase family protein [Duganella guangzhouensis]|nr:patatin-like phospholipase family protein [Duganella guangzhouensis]
MKDLDNGISIALSGGGVRAMAFHTGVLRYLAEKRCLENISEISSVSGGSLLIGLIFSKSKMSWPTSVEYLDNTRNLIKGELTRKNIQGTAILYAIYPWNWKFILSRANIVAKVIRNKWGVHGTLGSIPKIPSWSINCTTAETGRRFRFRDGGFGDYETGYANANDFSLAAAMSVSAAFPVGIGPYSLNVSKFKWLKRNYWNSKEESAVQLPYKRLHLYDGGVYDNLGLESFFDIGTGMAKKGKNIIVSDAGSPFSRRFDLSPLNPLRISHLMSVMMDQNRSLRVRNFVEAVKRSNVGAYIGISRSKNIDEAIAQMKGGQTENSSWLEKSEVDYVCTFSTSLGKLSEADFDKIERHGYETAKITNIAFPYLKKEN